MIRRAATLVLLPALCAAAADHPQTRPTRDVAVIYRAGTVDGGAVFEERMRWDVADQKLRVDPPSAGLSMLVDYRKRQIAMVRDADRKVLIAQQGTGGLPGEAAQGPYTRQGQEQIAGQSCTDWATISSAGDPTTTCITDDGVMLRASSQGHVLLEAVSVAYVKQDPALFEPPADYERVTPPDGAR